MGAMAGPVDAGEAWDDDATGAGPRVLLASGFHGWGVLGTVKVLLAWENRAV